MKITEMPAATMKLVGGRRCLDFVNTVGGRVRDGSRTDGDAVVILNDKLDNFYDLLAWSHHTGSLSSARLNILSAKAKRKVNEAQLIFERAIALRETIYRICRAVLMNRSPKVVDLQLLNGELVEARSHERLVPDKDVFGWQWVAGNELAQVLWPIAASAANLFTTADLTRLRECGGPACGWLFLDNSRNRSRQWCNMRDCGNVAKVRRFRSRLRTSKRN